MNWKEEVYKLQQRIEQLKYAYKTCAKSEDKLLEENQRLKQAIQTVAGEWPTYGYRRITEQLNRQGWQVNHKRVYRFMRQMGIQMVKKAHKKATTNSQHPYPRYPNLIQDLVITRPDQVWASDITYIRLGRGFVYLAVIMDLFTRSIRGWNLSRSLDQKLTLIALRRALQKHTPQIHHSDQGWQYAAKEYVELLQKAGVDMVEIGIDTTASATDFSPNVNIVIEFLLETGFDTRIEFRTPLTYPVSDEYLELY